MKKTEAVTAFGGVTNLAQALNVTRQAIYQKPEDLPQEDVDRIRGAALRLGVKMPAIKPVRLARKKALG